ncbi:MAG: hypothetical protein GY828_02490 [Candidatus Gracilibacteria bacterium]|nr:hypothetical protein [Candidatus Gracilibacteria bacterium]
MNQSLEQSHQESPSKANITQGLFDGNNLELIQEKLNTCQTSDLLNIILDVSKDLDQEHNYYLSCLILRHKISKNPSFYTDELKNIFLKSSAEKQIDINNALYGTLTFSNHRHFSNDFLEQFHFPSIETINTLFGGLKESSKNQFIFYGLNSTLSSYIDIQNSPNNFSSISHQLYKKYKVPGNNIHFKGHQFGSILHLSKDYLVLSAKDTAKGLTKIQPHILEFDEESEIQNDSFFLYDGMLDIYINKGLGEKNHHNYKKYKDDNLSFPSDFNISEYSHEIIAKILVYFHASGIEKITRIPDIFSHIFGGEDSDKIFHSFLELYKSLQIKDTQDILPHMRLFRDNNIQDTTIRNALQKFGEALHKSQISPIKDNRISLDLSSYQECIKKEAHLFNSFFPLDQSAGYIKSLHTPKMLNEFKKQAYFSYGDSIHLFSHIDEDLGVDITELLFSNQIQLFHFLWTKKPEEFNHFKQVLSLQKNKLSFLTTFLACSKTPKIGEKIIQLAQHKDSEKIFSAYSQIINLQSEVTEESEYTPFFKTILARGLGLLEDAYNDLQDGKTLGVHNKYEASLVRSGAFVKSLLTSQQKGQILEMDDFNKKSPDFHVDSFTGGNLISSDNEIDMLDPDNYAQSESFGVDDYKMLIKNIYDTYSGIDDNLIKILYKDIPMDLNNPNVTFYVMREKINNGDVGKLLALCKITKKPDGSTYWGTHYVESDYRGNFGIGSYVANLAFHDNKDQDIKAIVAKNNPCLEAQINHSPFVGTTLEADIGHNMESDLMVGIQLYKDKHFETKDLKKYSNDFFRKQVNRENDIYSVKICDSRPGFDQEYINTIQKYLDSGCVLTRIFYDRQDKHVDLSKTYLVFEATS